MAKLTREQVKSLMSIADVQLAGTYHKIYEKYGLERGRTGTNYVCYNSGQHDGGFDNNASMGISNENGQFNCFTCGTKGSLYSYWKECISKGGDKYHEFLINDLGVDYIDPDSGVDMSDADAGRMKDLYRKYANMHTEKTGKVHALDDSTVKTIDEENSLDMAELDRYVKAPVSYTHLTLPTKRIV